MKVLIVEPGKYPREADIEHTLEAEQAVVGGTIEAVYPWRDSACIVCNDNGIAENLPLNRMLGDYDETLRGNVPRPAAVFPAGQDPVCGTHYAGRLRAIYAGNKAAPAPRTGALI